MNYASLKPQYDRDGFVIVRKFLPLNSFVELRDNLDRYIRDVVPNAVAGSAFFDDPKRPETLKQMHQLDQDSFFAKLREGANTFRAVAEALIGESVEVEPPEWFNKPPGTDHATPAHQDNFYFCLRPCNVMTLWLAIDPADEENGCLRYIPGSHLEGIRPHGRTKTLGFSQGITDYNDADFAAEVPVLLQPGDITIHHGEMIHRADANKSATRHRRSFALVFKGVNCRRDEEAFARYQTAAQAQRAELSATGNL